MVSPVTTDRREADRVTVGWKTCMIDILAGRPTFRHHHFGVSTARRPDQSDPRNPPDRPARCAPAPLARTDGRRRERSPYHCPSPRVGPSSSQHRASLHLLSSGPGAEVSSVPFVHRPAGWRHARPWLSAVAVVALMLAALAGPALAQGGSSSLRDPWVSPRVARPSTTVAFGVTFRSADGRPAAIVRVLIDDQPRMMKGSGAPDVKHDVRYGLRHEAGRRTSSGPVRGDRRRRRALLEGRRNDLGEGQRVHGEA